MIKPLFLSFESLAFLQTTSTKINQTRTRKMYVVIRSFQTNTFSCLDQGQQAIPDEHVLPSTTDNSKISRAASDTHQSRVQTLPAFEENELGQFEFDSVCRLHKTAIRRIVPHPSLSSTHLLTIGDDGFLRNYMVDRSKLDTFYSVSSRPLTCLQAISVYLSENITDRSSLAFIGSSDQHLYIYNLETGTSILSQVLHSDVITDLYVSNRSVPTLLCTASHDATVRFWSLDNILYNDEEHYIFRPNYHCTSTIQMQYDISFDTSCMCMHALEEHELLVVGCQDGSIYLCHFQSGQILKQLTTSSTGLPILSLCLRADALFLAYLTGTTITLVDILTGTDVFTKSCVINNRSFNSLFYSSKILVVGLTNGMCEVWNLKSCEKIHTLCICDNISITAIRYHDGMFFFGTDDGSVHSYVFASRHPLSI